MKTRYLTSIILLFFLIHGLSASFYNVKDFGARGNGKTPDSHAINNAIEKAASAGGGTVYFPAGTYLSYSIRLKSNITLFFDNGAVLLA
jgi:polygalacturonase